MLTIIFNWIYMSFTCFCIGFCFAQSVEKHLHYSIKRMQSILMAGLIIATVYAQIVSLFYRVNAEANVVLLAAGTAVCVALRKQMGAFLKEHLGRLSPAERILIPLAFLLWSYFASRGYMVPDMDMYHGQSIRWIEEYGVVKGLGNLHSRFGYNSSLFALSALYSMKFLLGHSLHAVNGYLAFVLTLSVFDLGKAFRRRKMRVSDYARVSAIYYLTIIFDEIIAPSSDYAVMCVIFFIVIEWLSHLENGEEKERNCIVPYALLCVAAVYALTLKLSAGLIVLLTVKPAYMLIRKKKWGEIALYLALGLAVAVPWLARTVIITGWLLYPFANLDLFSVDWKITDIGMIRSDAYRIKVWAKAANTLEDTSLRSWFPYWFQNALTFTEKLLIAADIAACGISVVIAVVIFAKKRWEQLDTLLAIACICCSYLYWQFTAPMLRYGYAYVLLLAGVVGGYILERVGLAKAAYWVFSLYGVYKLYVCCDYIILSRGQPNYIWSETYGSYEVDSYEIDGITFYYSPYGGLTGYDPFPSAPVQAEMELRGEGMKDGFRPK